MKIFNKSKNNFLAQDAAIADSVFKRVKGLLGKKEFKESQGLVIRPCNSIHTFFMHFPIDVIFLDSNNRVVKAISNMKPFRMTTVYFKASHTVELPLGTIEKTSTAIGDLLLFQK